MATLGLQFKLYYISFYASDKNIVSFQKIEICKTDTFSEA